MLQICSAIVGFSSEFVRISSELVEFSSELILVISEHIDNQHFGKYTKFGFSPMSFAQE